MRPLATIAPFALALSLLGIAGCMLGTQYFNSNKVTKRDTGEYADMNPLGISGCKAKKIDPSAPLFRVYCSCGGGGSTEGCLDTEAESVKRGFDDYARRVCRSEGFKGFGVEQDEPVPSSSDEDSALRVGKAGRVRCQ